MEKHIHNYEPHIVPGNSSYAKTVKSGRTFYVVGDSHVKSTQRGTFNADLSKDKAILSTLINGQPDVVIIHVVTNDIISSNSSNAEMANEILKIAKSQVFISSILVKKNSSLTAVIRRVNDLLRDFCKENSIHFIGSYNYTSEYLWKGGIHLQNILSNI